MHVYLPIAELSVNIFTLLALGGATGFLSGLFGVGGGFLLTPFLIFLGISPAVAVSTSANQIIASSVSAFLGHLRRKNVDFSMGNWLLAGGLVGASLGVLLFSWLHRLGQIDLIISLCYVLFLGAVGTLMAVESTHALRGKAAPVETGNKRTFGANLPWQKQFPQSGVEVSVMLPLLVGSGVGVLVSLMGIGGGFFLIPAMIYLLRMPTNIVIGTSLYQIMFITAYVTLLQSVTTQTVDLLLALLLLSSAVVGAQFGTRLNAKFASEQLRLLLALLVLSVALKLGYGLFVPPKELFSVVRTS